MLATAPAVSNPSSPGRPAPPTKSAMKHKHIAPSTAVGVGVPDQPKSALTAGDTLPPLPASPRQQHHSAAVGSASNSPRSRTNSHGNRSGSGPHSRRASFSTASDSAPASGSPGTDAVQFLKHRTSQRKNSTSGASTPPSAAAAPDSPSSAPASAGSNGRKHRPAALQLGNHSTFASTAAPPV
ncbi:hypothetical protein BCR44DRAFT_49407, partial [Catenaria anguillulae PL171]